MIFWSDFAREQTGKMSDTWSDIQALKSRQNSMRERLARRKKEREGLVANITGSSGSGGTGSAESSGKSAASKKGELIVITKLLI